ncbi:TSUP family transporter [Duganella sp. FT135W]|uniref:Probable membrane transporter protein n=1 Tax=Duganella flavida TaxID=2692175 RepID=A0A6L8KCP0_9BURK|nr:sulfite exporter TauE/SafE family protein [Duganella flavida]MYM22201.1 TSUP family transporter [Duganella flavida]
MAVPWAIDTLSLGSAFNSVFIFLTDSGYTSIYNKFYIGIASMSSFEPTEQGSANRAHNVFTIFIAGGAVGALGGLIGLGGAEFRLPLLIGLFGFAAISAVMLNKTISLVVVASALIFRAKAVPVDLLLSNWHIAVNVLSGSLIGAWFGASWAVKMKSRTLYQTLAAMLVLIAVVLFFGHQTETSEPLFTGPKLIIAGVIAGFGIGVVAAIMGVAGGELLIPMLILLFGVDIKLAGSLSLAISLPTMLVAFFRFSKDAAFRVIRENKAFVGYMALGSMVGTSIGGHLVGVVSVSVLLPLLAAILLVSSVKVWKHK